MRRAILLALCVAVSSTTMAQGIFTRLFLGGSTRHAADMERQYRVVKGRKLGAFLAGKFAGKRAVILFPPETPMIGGEEGDPGEMPHVAVFKGLKAAMGDIKIVGTIEPKMPADVKAKLKAAGGEGDMMMMPETTQWFGVKELNKELAAFRGKYDILVCLTSLPGVEMMGMRGIRAVPFTELTCWTEKGVSVAIAEGGIGRFRSRIESGAICAAISYKMQIPDEDYEKWPAKDLDEAFNTRFVLITPDNVAKHATYFRGR